MSEQAHTDVPQQGRVLEALHPTMVPLGHLAADISDKLRAIGVEVSCLHTWLLRGVKLPRTLCSWSFFDAVLRLLQIAALNFHLLVRGQVSRFQGLIMTRVHRLGLRPEDI